jgi:putative copper resistance protein D
VGSILDIVTGWALYAALVAAIGGCLARGLIVSRVGAETVSVTLTAAAGRLAFGGALLLVPAMALFFVRQLLEFRDPFVPWTEDAELLLTATAWGDVWIRGAIGTGVAVLGLGLAARGVGLGWWIGGAAALALGAFPAFTGHASGADGPGVITLTADTLHVWAAAGWIGGLAFVLYAERRRRRGLQGGSLLPTLVPIFSPVAVACVGALIVTGAVGTWVHVPSLASLTESPYGRTLLVKLLLAAVVFALGLANWKRLTPRLVDADGPDALRRAATVELLVMQAVLIVTALLVRTAPPMG